MNESAAANGTSQRMNRHSVALLLLIAIGLCCRFTGVMWDNGYHLHPDERFLAITLPDLKWPHTAADYFQTDRAGLNPFRKKELSFFVYGQLPLVITKAVAGTLGKDNYDGLLLVGRILSALFDCGSVFFIFLIGRRIGGRELGLGGAALLALTALNIQQSHFFTVDNFATFFSIGSFYAAVCWAETPRHRFAAGAAIAAGLLLGAAMACKISSALFLAPLVVFAFFRARRTHWAGAFAELVLLTFIAFLVFRIAHPMAFTGEAKPGTLGGFLDIRLAQPADGRGFWPSLQQQRLISEGESDLPWNIQWLGRADYVFPLRNLMMWGTGLALGATAGCGLVLALCHLAGRLLRRSPASPHVALVAAVVWCLLCFLYYGGQFSKFTRYYLAITPFMALLAAWFYARLCSRGPLWIWRPAYLLTLATTAVWALAVTSIYTRPHPRVAASEWIRAHIPPVTPVANETSWDDTLPIRSAEYQMLNLELYEPDTPVKRELLLYKLDEARWIFISSNRTWASTTRLPMRYPMTTAFYRALFDGRLGFRPVAQFASYPRFLGFDFRDDSFEEALTVYDHPRVVLFRKTTAWSRKNAEQLLSLNLAESADITPLPNLRDSGFTPERDSPHPMPQLPFLTTEDTGEHGEKQG